MQLQISGTIPINVGEMTELNKLYVSLPLPSTRTALRVCLSLTLLSAHTHTHIMQILVHQSAQRYHSRRD